MTDYGEFACAPRCGSYCVLVILQKADISIQYVYLIKVCQEFNCTWAWELERKGYSEMTVESKTGILKVWSYR